MEGTDPILDPKSEGAALHMFRFVPMGRLLAPVLGAGLGPDTEEALGVRPFLGKKAVLLRHCRVGLGLCEALWASLLGPTERPAGALAEFVLEITGYRGEGSHLHRNNLLRSSLLSLEEL